jgi:predicted lactoylglutathione lyase
MTAPAHPGRMLFVNIPVADLERSKAFFSKLGFGFDPAFTDESAACMLVGEQAFVMLLGRETFAQYAKLPIADPRTHTLALCCFSVSTRDEVDAVCAAALAAGGTEADGAEDHGFMYSRSFFDLDGHGWQVMWMDPAAAPALVASTGGAGARTDPARAKRSSEKIIGRLVRTCPSTGLVEAVRDGRSDAEGLSTARRRSRCWSGRALTTLARRVRPGR